MKSKRWMPKVGEIYWRVEIYSFRIDVSPDVTRCKRTGLDNLDYGYNVFRTKKQATDALKKIKKILRGE